MKKICLLLISALLLLGACSQQDLPKLNSNQEDLAARGAIQQLQERKFESIEANLDAGLKALAPRASLEKMAAFFPPEPPKSIKVIETQTTSKNGKTQITLTYEYEFTSTWLLANVTLREKAGKMEIVGFHVVPEAGSIESRNKFTFAGKSALHYVVLVLGVAAALFTLLTLVACIRTRPLQRKWLWVIGILFGFGRFGVNWTTGETFFNIANIQVLSAGAVVAPFGPWMLSVSLPVFAILFWIRHKSLLR